MSRLTETENGILITNNTFVWCDNKLCEVRNDTAQAVVRRLFGQGESIVGTKGVNDSFYTRDHLASVRETVDSSGNMSSRFDYDPYGQQSTVEGGSTATFGYAGYFLNPSSKLLLTLFRAFDPSEGRWLTRDPFGEAVAVNLYLYANNNPIIYKDPYGLQPNQCSLPPPSGSPNSCQSFYSSPAFSQMPAYQQNAITACESTGSGPYATAIRLCLQQQQQQYLEDGGTLTTGYIYKVHQLCYQQAGCSGTPAGYWAWWGVTHIPIPSDPLMNAAISVFGSCSGKIGNFEGK
jgi:RHS repeat-associated protein